MGRKPPVTRGQVRIAAASLALLAAAGAGLHLVARSPAAPAEPIAAPAGAEGLPDRRITPGAVNEAIDETKFLGLCQTRGWTRQFRPPFSYTNNLKSLQMLHYGLGSASKHDFEEDHLIPLCLAGAPTDPHNLWPEPRAGVWNADAKDRLERKLCKLACDGRVPLREAQQALATNWIEAYQKYVAPYRRGSRDEWNDANSRGAGDDD